MELSGTIWKSGLLIDGGVAPIPSSVINVSTKSFRSKLLLGVVVVLKGEKGEKCPKSNSDELFDGGVCGGGACGGCLWW